MAVILKCPECEKKFRWKFGEEDRWPEHCPNCGAFVGSGRADDEIVMPAIRLRAVPVMDQVYRQMEAASEVRVQQAAEMAGVPASEMSGLKITNLNDRHDAECMAPVVNNSVTQRMAEMEAKGLPTGFGVPNATQYSGAVQSGFAPNAGLSAMQKLRGAHARATGGLASSDRPSKEVMDRAGGSRR